MLNKLLIAGLLMAVAGCKPQAPCLKSHTEMVMQPMMTGKTVILLPRTVSRCDVYCTRIDEEQACLEWKARMREWEAEHADE